MAPKAKTKAKTATAAAPTAIPAQPDWPPLKPVLPTTQQSLTSLLPGQILTTPLLTSSLAATYGHFLSTLPLITTPAPKRNEATRVNDRFQIHSPAFANSLWSQTGLSQVVELGTIDDESISAEDRAQLFGGEILGLNPNIRIYRYTKGQFFGAHYDAYNLVDFSGADGVSIPGRTTWTLLVYLSGPATGCTGGETVFYPDAPKKGPRPEPVVAALEVGLALLHRHGAECMLHEGREVTAGEKWVIRSDIVVRR